MDLGDPTDPLDPMGPSNKIGDLRAGIEAARRVVDDWDTFVRQLDGLAREREGQRAALERLQREHGELREAHSHVRQELDVTTRALEELRAAHDVVRAEREQATERLRELRERCDALVQDRQFAIDQLDVVLRRMKP